MELAVLSPSLEVQERSICIVSEQTFLILDEENAEIPFLIAAMSD
jgi:hypothetical protein